MARIRRSPAVAVLLAGLLLAGCSAESLPAIPTETAHTNGGVSEAPEASADGTRSTTLLAVIGTADDPEAYVIGILDEQGALVTSVPAGDYRLTFVDNSQMHNFHLTGEGVDVATDVQGSDASTVEITLVAGTYTFVCDPHQGTMRGELEVTG